MLCRDFSWGGGGGGQKKIVKTLMFKPLGYVCMGFVDEVVKIVLYSDKRMYEGWNFNFGNAAVNF